MEIKAEILTIGDEILFGQIIDTNSQWISSELDKIGVLTVRRTAVGDDANDITDALRAAEQRCDIIIMTGGLGPTKDDITKDTLATYFGCGMSIHEEALANVKRHFEKRGREILEGNRLQANLPNKASYLPNNMGTAPGMHFSENGCELFVLPGVPYEMKALMEDQVLHIIKNKFKLPVIYHRILRTAAVGESVIAYKIADWENALPEHIKLAYLPSLAQVKLRLTAKGDDLGKLKADVKEQEEKVKAIIGKYIYGKDNDEIAAVVGKLLLDREMTMCTAESCTGGYLAHMITSVPGCGDYYLGSLISYDVELKTGTLNIDPEMIEEHGAVNEPVAKAMAENVRKKLKSDIGLATTGLAGPTSGVENKPVGTIWLGYADGIVTKAWKLQLGTDRHNNIVMTSVIILEMLRRQLLGIGQND